MKKRLFGIFLSLALVLSMMPLGLIAVQAESGTATTGEGTADNPYIVHNWIALKDIMAEGGFIQLGEDVTDQTKNSSSYLSVPSGATVTLDLNGHKIDRGLTSATAIENGYVILAQGSLTVTDSSTDKTGMITGGNNSDNGGGVYVSGTFNMSGGTIVNNSASGAGGGVMIVGAFNMSSGSITGNKASRGGGVWLNYGSMSLTGGSITENTADAECGGVVITTQTTFNLSGNPIVTGNTIGSGTTCNLWLGGSNGSGIISDSMIKVTAPLTQGASIGVTLGEGRSTRQFTDGFEENNPDTKPAAFFTSDDSNYYVGDAEEGVLSRVTSYDLWVGGTQVTDANLTGSGWTYTPLTNTLALSNASITAGYEFNNGYSAAIYANQNLTITGTGTVGSEGIACGICVDGANTLTVDGADTNLTVSGTSNGMDAYAMNGNIVINNGIVNTTGGGNGIKTNKGTVTVNGGTVTATGTGNGTIASGNGITTDCFIIHDGKVTARGNETDNTSYGIFCNNTDPNKTCYSFYGGEVLATGGSEGVLTNRSMVSSGGVTKLISLYINGTEPIDFSARPAGAGSSIFYKWFHSYPSTYVISFMPGDGTGTMAEVTVLYGDYVLPASTFTAPSGKVFDRWQTDRYGSDYIETFAAGAVVSISDNTTFTATWKDAPAPSGGGGGEPSYKVEVPGDVENGSVTVKPTSAKEGDTVTITPTPDEGFVVEDVKVTDKDGKEIEVTDNGDGTYSFKMPASKVTVTPVIIEDGDVPLVNRPFVDVPEDSWFYDAVYYCYDNGSIKGVDETHFAPNDTTTRAMIVTILWRMEGQPEAAASSFTDVESGSWYEEAVNWAAEKEIVKGMSETTFAPTANITREQMATILARYAEFKGKKGDDYAVDLSGFTDLDSVSDWALDAMNWSVASELMKGVTETTLDPKGNATRAQVAVLMQRLCENVLK